MSNNIKIESLENTKNYFSRDSLLRNFLSIIVIYISLISIASYFIYSPVVSYSLFLFSLFLFILRLLFAKNIINYNTAALTTIILVLFLIVPICAYYSDGLFSPILWWVIIVPIISLLLFGRSSKTTTFTAISALLILIFGILKFSNYKLPAYDKSHLTASVLISLLGFLILSYTLTWIFEIQKTDAYIKLNDEKERLKLSEEGFRDIFNNTDELIQNVSLSDSKFIYVNPSWLRTMEYSEEELNELTFEKVLHPDSKIQYYEFYKKLMANKNIENIEFIFSTKNGNKVFVKGEAGLVEKKDRPYSFRGIFRNVTNEHKAALNIRQSQLALEEAQELAQLGSWELNLIDQSPVWSKEMYRIFEVNSSIKEKELFQAFQNKLPSNELKVVNNLFKDVFENNIVSSAEIKINNLNNKVKYINIIVEPLKSTNSGKIIGVKGTAQDVTKQKLAVMAKSNFLSTMSHEIRTPINGVLGIANLLKTEKLTDTQREYVETLHFSSQHLLSIVSEILDFSKMESGNFTFEKVSFNLDDLCKKVFNAYDQNALQKNIQFTYTPMPQVPIDLIGDKLRLQQVLSNLVSNAIKFTEDGKVDFSFNIKSETNKQATIEFKISDTGIGITEEYQKKIFDTFSQVDETATRQYGGTGLGLAISKRLVDLQFGKLYVESKLNVGSTFYVELTFDKQNESKLKEVQKISNLQQTEIAEKPKLSGMRILVAEDNSINAMVVTRFLTNWGVIYDVAKNGQIAIEQLESQTYDLILMDLQMPVLGGREATKIIRNMDGYKSKLPIIALTADAFVDFENTLSAEGFDAYISKPFNPNDLFNTILKFYNSSN